MALSNIGREPQREITESIVGILIIGLLVWSDYKASMWLHNVDAASVDSDPIPWQVAMIIVPIGVVAAIAVAMGILYVTHAIGEDVCNALARRGLDPRPRNRK